MTIVMNPKSHCALDGLVSFSRTFKSNTENSLIALPSDLLFDCLFASGNPLVFVACRAMQEYKAPLYKYLGLMYFERYFIRQLCAGLSDQHAPLTLPWISQIFRRIAKEADSSTLLDEISPLAQHQAAQVIEDCSVLILCNTVINRNFVPEEQVQIDVDGFNIALESAIKPQKHFLIHEKAVWIDTWMRENRSQLSTIRDIEIEYEMPILPKHIGYFTATRELHLAGCKILHLATEIGSLIHLKVLDLSRNRLSALPLSFRFLNEVEELNLSENRFAVVPTELCCLRKIRILNLSFNQLNQLPNELPVMQNLNSLDISCNVFSQFPNQICLLSVLRILDVSHNQLQRIPSCIDLCTRLECLDLADNPFTTLLPSQELFKLATDYHLTRLNVNSHQMRLLRPDVCKYLQREAIVPHYVLTRSPGIEDFSQLKRVV